MIVGRIAKCARTMTALLAIAVVCSLALGMDRQPAPGPGMQNTPAVETDSIPSVTCIPFGLYGDMTTGPLAGRLADNGDNLTFVGTTNGLYVVAPGGRLQHFLYSPFGVKHVTLINDINADGIREVVVALDDTQVPALRCYNGATWEKIWQFAPMTRIWDKQWGDRQITITNLEVVDDGNSQSLLVTSGRSVFSINAKEGTKQWQFTAPATVNQMVILADLNDDGADEAFVGSDDGQLCWISTATGDVEWQTRLPGHKGVDYDSIAHRVSDIVVVDEESGRVVVASADGWAQMYNMEEKSREWETPVFEYDQTSGRSSSEDFLPPGLDSTSELLLLSPASDITGDGLPEILATKAASTSQYEYSVYTNDGKAALCDSCGNILWEKEGVACSNLGVETSLFEGKPVFLQRGTGEIRLVDLEDGESVLRTIPLGTAIDPGLIVKQPGADGYLTFSSTGDLAAISAKGELLWYYPRIGTVKAEDGSFVGNDTKDVLFWCESGAQQSADDLPAQGISRVVNGSMASTSTTPSYSAQAQDSQVRLLGMMDGSTWKTVWSYEVPHDDFKTNGGLKGMQVVPDLVGSDNVQDIIGYSGDRVFIFSGKNGTATVFSAGQSITSLEVIDNGVSGSAFAVGVTGGLMILDAAGSPVWTTTSAAWLGGETSGGSQVTAPGTFMVMDDVNSDNISDLAVVSSTRIVALNSSAATATYQLGKTFLPDEGWSIGPAELVADSDGDGLRELAYFLERADERGPWGRPRHQLCVQSLEDGQCLSKADLQGSALAYDLACGDFNADGYPDSVLAVRSEGTDWLAYDLRIVSGKDGISVWTHIDREFAISHLSSKGSSRLPAMSIGDVNGDGADDLARSVGYDPDESLDYRERQRLQVVDIVRDATFKDIAVTPRLYESSNVIGWCEGSMLQTDFDADGCPEVVMMTLEPSMPSYDADARTDQTNSDSLQYLALVDIDSGRRLVGFTGFETKSLSLFDSSQPYVLGVAGCGGVCFLNMRADLQITSPEDGANTAPIVGVTWQCPTDGDFTQVFVDGVRNDITGSLESELFLARGDHDIVVRSVDEYGRISYGPSDLEAPLSIEVAPSPWKPVWLVVSLFALLAVVVLLLYARLHRRWRGRQRAR